MSEKQMKFSEPNPVNNMPNTDITTNTTGKSSYFSYVSDFFQNNKYIVVGVILLLVVGYFVYKYYFKNDEQFNEHELQHFKQPNNAKKLKHNNIYATQNKNLQQQLQQVHEEYEHEHEQDEHNDQEDNEQEQEEQEQEEQENDEQENDEQEAMEQANQRQNVNVQYR